MKDNKYPALFLGIMQLIFVYPIVSLWYIGFKVYGQIDWWNVITFISLIIFQLVAVVWQVKNFIGWSKFKDGLFGGFKNNSKKDKK